MAGSFGKSMLCQGSGLAQQEAKRRANRLQECIDYVRWHARRVWPKPVLVVTYKDIEEHFGGISNVETAHFNAVAGIDRYKDVAMLISIGRPLPSHLDAEAMAGAFFGQPVSGSYRQARIGVRMSKGEDRSLLAIRHSDPRAEILRAAICDDELIQVIGRGRGVNRTSADPLEVHVLADVALPLVIDRITSWDVERPDIFQRMLNVGVAVDSPSDAAALHPEIFGNEKQAQKELERAGFKRQNPIRDTYREMSLKSAAYRRAGRGHGWQRAWWIGVDEDFALKRLTEVLIGLEEWQPDRFP